jgi:glyoxylase-like metal-dependent hydrolase (beta-lactamase superfamily II)
VENDMTPGRAIAVLIMIHGWLEKRNRWMVRETAEILQKGDENGNNMVIRFRLPSGREIIGLPTQNYYGGEWDLGPTWNYLVLDDGPFLVDTGRTGTGETLLEMVESSGVSPNDLEYIVLSHGHEDHDGGLWEIVRRTGTEVKAHRIYDRLIRFYPDQAPAGARKDFPASCWRCMMPESFSRKNCLVYHEERNKLKIEQIGDGICRLGETTQSYHVPGHSPDSLAILVSGEVILVGDTVLPEITPFPTNEAFFDPLEDILKPEYTRAGSIYGLNAYIRSLKRLREISRLFPHLLVLPAHRLFYGNNWNDMDLGKRANEIIQHHIERCADILRILRQGPKTPGEIAVEHFDAPLLKGAGMVMAKNEVLCHCELLCASGDVRRSQDKRFETSGGTNFEALIESLEPY